MNWRQRKNGPSKPRTRAQRELGEPRRDNFRSAANELPPRLRKKAEGRDQGWRGVNGPAQDVCGESHTAVSNHEEAEVDQPRIVYASTVHARMSHEEDWDGFETPSKHAAHSSGNWDKAPGSNRKVQENSSNNNTQAPPMTQTDVTSQDRMTSHAKSDDYNLWGSSSLGRTGRRWGDWGPDESWDPALSSGDAFALDVSPTAPESAAAASEQTKEGELLERATCEKVRKVTTRSVCHSQSCAHCKRNIVADAEQRLPTGRNSQRRRHRRPRYKLCVSDNTLQSSHIQ